MQLTRPAPAPVLPDLLDSMLGELRVAMLLGGVTGALALLGAAGFLALSFNYGSDSPFWCGMMFLAPGGAMISLGAQDLHRGMQRNAHVVRRGLSRITAGGLIVATPAILIAVVAIRDGPWCTGLRQSAALATLGAFATPLLVAMYTGFVNLRVRRVIRQLTSEPPASQTPTR